MLNTARAVARAWRVRERVEQEAALLFAGLAERLREVGMKPNIVALAEKAADDEVDHAARCRRIVEAHDAGLEPLALGPPIRLGPPDLAPRERALYEAVALSCVTETMSVALLGGMRTVVRDELIAGTVHHILQDEIDHARIGWAVLAVEARRGDVAWLSAHIAGMVRDALHHDPPAADAAPEDLSAYGVLTRPRVEEIVRATLDDVILPGLRSFGISPG